MRGKKQEKHSYFWLVGAGGPGNYRQRTKRQDVERTMIIRTKCKAVHEKIPFNLSLGDAKVPIYCPILKKPLKLSDGKSGRCGGELMSPSIDRVIPKKGYVKGNVRVISLKANSIKGTCSLAELEDRLRKETIRLAELKKVVRFLRKINT